VCRAFASQPSYEIVMKPPWIGSCSSTSSAQKRANWIGVFYPKCSGDGFYRLLLTKHGAISWNVRRFPARVSENLLSMGGEYLFTAMEVIEKDKTRLLRRSCGDALAGGRRQLEERR
jgi:hypothetical protein